MPPLPRMEHFINSKLITVLMTITIAHTHPSHVRDCPASCKCSWILDSLEVDCSRHGLVQYPSFGNLPVEHLDLSGNQYQEFPTQLATIESLILLDLSDNQIHYLDPGALVGFMALRTLILTNNSFSGWTDLNANYVFYHAPNLRYISLSMNPLKILTDTDQSSLIFSQSLLELDLSYCDMKIASNGKILNGMPNLDRLNLTGNPLAVISSMPSKSLRVLEVSNCSLKKISRSLFSDLPNLQSLIISFNPGIDFGTGDNQLESYGLSKIDLSFCFLDTIELGGFPSLTVVRLRGNMLRGITEKTFAKNLEIEILDLGRNSIRQMSGNAFSMLPKLTKLDLSYNEISAIDRNLFRKNDALAELNLSRNILNKFQKFLSNSLREIDLSWCEILIIESDALSGFPVIVKLDLSNNFLKEFPRGMHSETLKMLDLSNCRLTSIRNDTFNGFPELAGLSLTGNRLTNPFPVQVFQSNAFLDDIWLGDNPWRCDCDDSTFFDFYFFVNGHPAKLKDKGSVRCASPAQFYGRTWESACQNLWMQQNHRSSVEKVWASILVLLLILIGVLVVTSCLRKLIEDRAEQRNSREYRENLNELMEIRRQNRRILEQDAQPNAPTSNETNLPTYEAALLMPKIDRTSKSMTDLSSSRSRNRSRRGGARQNKNYGHDGLVVDIHHRFLSEEMLSNRVHDRTIDIGSRRRMNKAIRHHSSSRRFSFEDSRFPAAHVKSQNLQSAEQLALFQSYENSPYSKRRPKETSTTAFRRAIYDRASVEFLTDSECNSKRGSPFARRQLRDHEVLSEKPSIVSEAHHFDQAAMLEPAVEDHFGKANSRDDTQSKSSSLGSDFQLVKRLSDVDITSLPDYNSSDSESTAEKFGNRQKESITDHKPMRQSPL